MCKSTISRIMVVHDSPLEDISDDKFGREPIVELVVDSINQVVSSNHDCVVYGIYGKWGEGKTSLMNFIKERLIKQGKTDRINIVEFNPWLVNNDEALLREFFKSIMNDPDKTIRRAFQKYGSLAIFASKTIVNAVAPGVGDTLAKGIKWAKNALDDSIDTLNELKKKASKAIVDSGRHLVIMIDDVDRLDKDELHAVLRLIRQVADFKNCIYIVAMDVDMVAKSIGDYHGKGSMQDGRKFLDKIVQVPISLPRIPNVDMKKLISEELAVTLRDYTTREIITEISKAVEPFISTHRELRRYCNQISFVLPHLKDEVNIKELCLLETIKMVSAESYNRIHECRSQLMHESSSFNHLLNAEKEYGEIEKRYQEAKEYIEEGLEGGQKDSIDNAIDELFGGDSYDYQEDLDKKRLLTDVYFPKYFSMTVPSDLIPDRELDAFRACLFEAKIEDISCKLDEWNDRCLASETKRAALYLTRKFLLRDERCKAASILAKALSISKLAKGLPPHVYVDQNNVPSFVVHQLIYSYMFVQDPQYAQMNVWDEAVLNETLSFIFEKGEMNYCMNVLCSADSNIFSSGVYEGRNVMSILIKRFTGIGFEGQFKYSKFLLLTILNRWKRVDADSFNEYARDLFVNREHDLGLVFKKFIDGTDDSQDVANFVRLFTLQIPEINERLQDESEEVRLSQGAKIYASNYRHLIEQ